ncbi:MAG: hypothetical protein KF745_04220 [Phycisphaeraceae bacterium]|nr:hypothetical protein [Phycisphaeraceae bacterium]
MRTRSMLIAGLAVSASAAYVNAQPTIDGMRDGMYGPAIWFNSENPTQFGDNNYTPPAPCSPTSGAGVSTGVEVSIPLANIGNPSEAAIRIAAFINGSNHDFMANQVVGGIPAQANLGEPRNVNFQALSLGGNQYVPVIVASTAAAPPTVDGSMDGAYAAAYTAAGQSAWVQNLGTGFGNATTGTIGACNGSEIDGAYAIVAGPVNDRRLYVFIPGNVETNNNKLEIFIDTNGSGSGQNRILNTNAPIGNPNGGVNRMGGAPAASNGVRFDVGFAPDYWLGIGNNTAPTNPIYVDWAELLTAGNGAGGYAGGTTHGVGTLTGGDGILGIEATINNSNVGGVDGCQPSPGQNDFANGSEIDAIYAYRDSTYLYLMVTGNVQTNNNTLNLFFDVQKGGQQQLRGSASSPPNVDIDFNGLNNMGQRQVTQPIDPGAPGCDVPDPCNNGCPCETLSYSGMKFDNGFSADYWISVKNSGNPVIQYANAAFLRTNGRAEDILFNSLDYGSYFYAAKSYINPLNFPASFYDVQADPFVDPGATLPNLYTDAAPRLISANPYNPASVAVPGLILATMNNSNLAGVTDTLASQALATAVTTGVELRIRLDELGATPTSVIRLAGFVASQDYTFGSNQVIGGLPAGTGNLGTTSAIDFTAIAGNQFVVINPPVVGPDCFTKTATNVNGLPQAGGANGTADSTECVGDWDRNGTVEPADIAQFIQSWSFAVANPGLPNIARQADLDCNGAVEPSDIAVFIQYWVGGTTPGNLGCP